MATLRSLKQDIDAGKMAARMGHSPEGGYTIRDMVYRDFGEYVWLRFDTDEPKPQMRHDRSFDFFVKKDLEHHEEGAAIWLITEDEAPAPTGTREFYIFLNDWFKAWRRSAKKMMPEMEKLEPIFATSAVPQSAEVKNESITRFIKESPHIIAVDARSNQDVTLHFLGETNILPVNYRDESDKYAFAKKVHGWASEVRDAKNFDGDLKMVVFVD